MDRNEYVMVEVPELEFVIEGARPEPHAVSPVLNFKLRITNSTPTVKVRNVALHCQLRIEAPRRQYGPRDQERLVELFGAPERWGQTLKSLLWTHVGVSIPAFDGARTVDLPVLCSFDFNVAATKYFHGLEDGEVPLLALFSGTVFYAGADGVLQLAQIPWSKETSYRLPLEVWQAMMDRYYPDRAWLQLRRDVLERVYGYKRRQGFPTFEQALTSLLDRETQEATQA